MDVYMKRTPAQLKPLTSKKTLEQRVRGYAEYVALRVRGPKGGPFTLEEKYGPKRRLGGPYHSLAALMRDISRCAVLVLARREASRNNKEAA